MGKNQQHKQQQRSRHGGEGEDLPTGDTSVDVSFHTPEWHAARVAALTAERKTWEEWKSEQKEKASIAAAVEDEEDRQNRCLDHRKFTAVAEHSFCPAPLHQHNSHVFK